MILADRHWTTLVARIEQEYTDRSKQITTGYPKTLEEYRERVGYLAALKDIGRWSEEIIREMDAKPPKREA